MILQQQQRLPAGTEAAGTHVHDLVDLSPGSQHASQLVNCPATLYSSSRLYGIFVLNILSADVVNETRLLHSVRITFAATVLLLGNETAVSVPENNRRETTYLAQ